MFVQMGSIFAILYLGLLFLVFSKTFQLGKKNPQSLLRLKLIMVPLTGFFIQSLSVDSLMYPDVNLVFHSILAILVSYNWADKKELAV